MMPRIHFTASPAERAQRALRALIGRYGDAPLDRAHYVVALGGDGFMLQTLHAMQGRDLPVYGMNRGTVGFLLNSYTGNDLPQRLAEAEETIINPLRMRATCVDGSTHEALAINEVSMLRQGPQAAKLRIHVDGRLRMEELVCDGALIATPAGSTAYNYSAHGPILPLDSQVLALTAIAPFRPRRWRGALLPKTSEVVVEVADPDLRPVMADADSRSVRHVTRVVIRSASTVQHRLLFDPGHGLEERLLREQFV
ncbi:NAD kinase [Paracoccus sp. (in: a-proteobacteria)]|uniref:NAD kinase n=1 Tax=Paracoccus sp. TaxID=267 RepID=UPI0026E0F4C8|nr:NAD kinase [Paracoccus sp. (in: a-proteobacteria)]MDO5646591.1 NAD kinase [Paracoccus sp. (in: a-proteobacteria)]